MKTKTYVLKFGGTSVADKDALENVCDIVSSYLPNRVSVVVSALGKSKGYGKVTDELIRLRETGDMSIIDRIRDRHVDLIRECVPEKIWKDAILAIDEVIACLRADVTGGAEFIESYGEILSLKVIYHMLRGRGIDVVHVSALDVVHYESGFPLYRSIDNSGHLITSHLDSGKITITEGFIASDHGNRVCMTRGGSDKTATIVGRAIGADEIMIYSDRSGVLSADPEIVKDAKFIDEMSYAEAEEMAGHGARILYTQILEPLRYLDIPIVVRNTFRPDDAGTRIVRASRRNGVKCITVIPQTHVSIHNCMMAGEPGFLSKFFSCVKNDIDVVVTGNPIVGFTTSDEKCFTAGLNVFGDIRKKVIYTVAIVGEGVENNPFVLNRVFYCLTELGVDVEFISYDRMSAAIYFGVRKNENLAKLINMLHSELIRD